MIREILKFPGNALSTIIRRVRGIYINKTIESQHKKFVYGDARRPVVANRVNVVYWKPAKGNDNVGDRISLEIVRDILKSSGLDLQHITESTHRLLGIGSILHDVYVPSTIWGSGLHHYGCRIPTTSLDVRAVRGPLTYSRLREAQIPCPRVFGDPGILVTRLFQPSTLTASKDYVVIPHFTKEAKYSSLKHNVLSTITADWLGFLQQISDARLVISGSLHGIIFADALGIPAILLEDTDQDLFKYEDYYFSTGRYSFPIARSIEEARLLTPPPHPDLNQMRHALLQAFPFDLWKNAKPVKVS